jgi:hypothetical protein
MTRSRAPRSKSDLIPPGTGDWGGAMRIHRQTVEHPFGTIRAWMRAPRFLTRGLKRVGTEMERPADIPYLRNSHNLLANVLKAVLSLVPTRVNAAETEIPARPVAVASTTTTSKHPGAVSDLHRDLAPRGLKRPPVLRSKP